MVNEDSKYNKLRRQKINVMLNEEERRIIKEKAIKYGYGDCLAEYIRAACIYENIYVEDVEGKTEICDIVSKFIEILRSILKEQQVILKNLMLSHTDVEIISSQNEQIVEMIDSLSRNLISLLSVNTHHQVQKRKTALDNHKFSGKIIQKLLESEKGILTLRPSNLHSPNHKIEYLVYLPDYTYNFDLTTLKVEQFFLLVNQLRDIAMKKQLYLSFYKAGNFLRVGITMDFQEYETSKKYSEEIKADRVFSMANENELIGDAYSNNS